MKKKTVKAFLAYFVTLGVIIFLMDTALSIPKGYYDSMSGKCLGVLVEGTMTSCDIAPRHEAVMTTKSIFDKAVLEQK